ncbi:MAG TPA: hypothetical protein VIY56_14285 [Vicinamibacterales bacterium]
MRRRQLQATAWLAGLIIAGSTQAALAQAPRTPWGEPDLQGTWTSESELSVPFERPREYGTRQTLTDSELASRRATLQKQADSDNADFDLETADRSNAGQVGSATSPPPHWLERGKASRRSSMVIEPADGRVPPMTEEGQRRLRELRGTFAGGNFNAEARFKGPEDLSLWERCITRGVPAAIFPTVYNANTRIVQGPGVVAITYEMIHETRIVHTDGRAHVAGPIRGYHGDSRGHWDGDTLVVDVTNFSPKSDYRGAREALHLVERFTRTRDGLRYEVSVDDPHTWSRSWAAALELTPQPEAMFEYACHEGNNSMRNILSGARAAER